MKTIKDIVKERSFYLWQYKEHGRYFKHAYVMDVMARVRRHWKWFSCTNPISLTEIWREVNAIIEEMSKPKEIEVTYVSGGYYQDSSYKDNYRGD